MRGQLPDLQSLVDPTGPVPPGGIVVRPSLRAAVGNVLQVAFYLTMIFVGPLLLVSLFSAEALPEEPPLPFLAAIFLGVWAEVIPLVLGVGVAFLRIGLTRYVLDKDGIHVRSQVLSAKEERVPWEKVTAVLQKRTIFDSLLRIERVHVVAYGRAGRTLHLVGLRDAAPLRNLVASRMLQSSSVESLRRRD